MLSSCRRSHNATTLPEFLIAVAILFVILATVLEFCTAVERSWKSSAADPFAEAQDAFETVVRSLQSATLQTYQDYADASGNFRTNSASVPPFVPDHPARRSDLDFVCGPGAGSTGLLAGSQRITTGSAVFFLAPQGESQTLAHEGMARLLNAMGYFVEFGPDDTAPGFIFPQAQSWRWRLKQALQPAESLQIFTTFNSSNWIQNVVPPGSSVPILAENVIALVVLPERSHDDYTLAPAFGYDSRNATNKLTLHQLPACLQVALVAIDEVSAEKLAAQNGSNPPSLVSGSLFQQAAQLSTDLATLDATLTAAKVGHRIFQREFILPSAAWSNTASP